MKNNPDDLAERLAAMVSDWLPTQRWFASKQRSVTGVVPIHAVTLAEGAVTERPPEPASRRLSPQPTPQDAPDDAPAAPAIDEEPRLEHLVVRVSYADTDVTEMYQLLIGLRHELPERLEYAHIGTFGTEPDAVYVYDAVHDPDCTGVVLRLLASDAKVGEVTFTAEPGVTLDETLVSRPVQAEQSHTSVIYGERYILKLFRKLHYGMSPDLELHRALREQGCTHVAQPYAAVEGGLPGDDTGEPVTFGLMQEYFANSAEGWGMATVSVRDLFSEAVARPEQVGGDFAAEARRLGLAVARVHADLAVALGTHELSGAELAAGMRERLASTVERVPQLAPYAEAIGPAFDAVGALSEPIRAQRIHGDLHLGQTLRTLSRWVLIDLEGEPVRPLRERRQPLSPLQDVAGMLRSFDYAAHHLLLMWEGDDDRRRRAIDWVRRNREAFCDGYAAAAATSEGTVLDPRAHPVLMRALELDKAVYEVAYELDNRPTWIQIPLGSIARLVG